MNPADHLYKLVEYDTYELDRHAEYRKRQRQLAMAQAEADEVDELAFHDLEIQRLVPEAQEMAYRRVSMEYSHGRGISDRTVVQRMVYATELRTKYLRVYEHLRAGDFLYNFAEVFPRAGYQIHDHARRQEFIDRLLPHALKPMMTRHRLQRIGTTIAETLNETPIEDRRDTDFAAESLGGVELIDCDNGLAQLRVTLPAPQAHAAKDRIAKIARAKELAHRKLRAEDPALHVPRIGVFETETFMEIVNGKLDDEYQHIKGEIRITVPALSLLTGDSRHTTADLEWLFGELAGISGNAEMGGYGPVSIGDISSVCGIEKTWLRMFIEPQSGVLLTTDKYEATVGLKNYLNFRDPTCRWGSCNVRAKDCDKDHTVPYRILPETSPNNIAHLCRRHHVAKHRAGFTLKQLGDGILEWTTSTGKTIISEPHRVEPQRPISDPGSTVSFRPVDPVPPPF